MEEEASSGLVTGRLSDNLLVHFPGDKALLGRYTAEFHAAHNIERILKILLGFPRKTDNDIRRNRGVRPRRE